MIDSNLCSSSDIAASEKGAQDLSAEQEEAQLKPPKPEATPIAVVAKQIASKPTRRWRVRFFQVYLVAATASFGILLVLASLSNYFPIDLSITRGVQTINAAWFSNLMWAVSLAGYAPQAWLLVGAVVLLLFFIGLRWEAIIALVAALGAAGLGNLIKLWVHRPRPGADLVHVVQQLNDLSFPSGHVLLYTAFFGFLVFLAYTLLKPSWARTLTLAILGSLVGLVGLSRIYLGNHWASDVIGAYLLGSLWLALSIAIYRWGETRFFIH
ncbi:MAG: phosphatase PAP2 family protein [Anaerolineae bacterium]|nr:phosphatase PAP2 family protein [Anaerolineae bacterium]